MVSRGLFRALGASLAALLLALVGVSAVSAAPECIVTVSPSTGAAGTAFTFHGKGFQPTHLSLHKGGTEAGDHDLSKGGDPWTLAVRSRPGDEGSWTAEFTSDQCSAETTFTVTLSNTDVAVAPGAGLGNELSIPLAVVLLAAVAGGGIFVGRRLRPFAVDNQSL